MQVESTNINTNELNKIKEGLINQYKSDSDKSDSSSEFSDNSESDLNSLYAISLTRFNISNIVCFSFILIILL